MSTVSSSSSRASSRPQMIFPLQQPEKIDVAALQKSSQQNEAMDATLTQLLELAERKNAELAARNALQSSVDESIRDANVMLTETLTLLAAQRDRQAEHQATLRNARIGAISRYNNLIAEKEEELNRLRTESKRIDFELIASDGELRSLQQKLATARMLQADQSDRGQDVAATEHSMLQDARLFDALRLLPTAAQTKAFYAKVESDQYTDPRVIRLLSQFNEEES